MHDSVLLQAAVDALAIKPTGVYVDGTFGRGGHSKLILSKLSERGQLWVFDKDKEAITEAEALAAKDARLKVHHGSFAELGQLMAQQGLLGQLDGILLDLGVSSPQLDQAERGFSFMRDGPLDMRMNQEQGKTAAEWINQADQRDISRVLRVYGEEKFANLIAKHIVLQRGKKPFERTLELANLIADVIPARAKEKHKHPATRSFQALRIFINAELDDLQTVLNSSVDVLAKAGRLVVISFHSLEDRLVKHFIREQQQGPEVPRYLPVMEVQREPHLVAVGKAVKAGEDELEQNVRARSAVMRIAEKVVQSC